MTVNRCNIDDVVMKSKFNIGDKVFVVSAWYPKLRNYFILSGTVISVECITGELPVYAIAVSSKIIGAPAFLRRVVEKDIFTSLQEALVYHTDRVKMACSEELASINDFVERYKYKL
jgi:hypothetical protein